MKVPYVEDLANHSSPESCGGCGNVSAEALTGGSVGGLLSSEITIIRVPTLCTEGEGHVDSSVKCELLEDPAESEKLSMRGYFARGNQEVREKPGTEKLEWGNPGNKNLPVHRSATYSMQVKNTKTGRRCRVGQGRCNAIRLAHKISRKSDNNIVPGKQTNKGKYRPGGVCGGKGVD
jgi:hypothetical protein